jgi:capsule polysaccharide export protein KpsE/RkpR
MLKKKGDAPTQPTRQQQAVTTAGRAFGVQVVLTSSGGQAEPETLQQLADGYSPTAQSSKDVLLAQTQVAETANAADTGERTFTSLTDAAKHAALASHSGRDSDLNFAQIYLDRLKACKSKAQVQLVTLQAAFASAIRDNPAKKKVTGGNIKARLQQNAAALVERDKAIGAAVEGSVSAIAKEREDSGKLLKLLRDMSDKFGKFIKEYEEIEAAKQAYQGALKARDGLRQDALEKLAAEVGVDYPDFDPAFDRAANPAAQGDWKKAAQQVASAVVAIDQFRRELKRTQKAKQDYEQDKEGTNRKISSLDSRFDGAKVKDKSLIGQLRSTMTDINQAAGRKEWRVASKHVDQFEKQCAEAENLAAEFETYSGGADPKLTTGVILDIFKLPGVASNTDALAKLATAYSQQCAVPRIDWITHLGIAGDNVKVGTDRDHYTTFNDSVPATIGSVTVENQDADKISTALFTTVVAARRIHATFVEPNGTRRHKYWGGHYSVGVAANAFPDLEARYDQMVQDMRRGIGEAIAKHGRIGAVKSQRDRTLKGL